MTDQDYGLMAVGSQSITANGEGYKFKLVKLDAYTWAVSLRGCGINKSHGFNSFDKAYRYAITLAEEYTTACHHRNEQSQLLLADVVGMIEPEETGEMV